MLDGKAFGRELVDVVKAYVERMLKPLEIRLAVTESKLIVAELVKDVLVDLKVKLAVLEDRVPVKGDKGDPGLGFEDMSVEHDGERAVVLRFARGDQVKEFPVVFPVPIYRGVYRPNGAYVRGDEVTFGGSMWHCNAATEEKPGDGSAAWTLATKRGRDGKNSKEPPK